MSDELKTSESDSAPALSLKVGGICKASNMMQEPEADHDFLRCESPRAPFRSSENHAQAFKTLNDMRIHRQLCDVVLVGGDVEIPAHKCVLASCSPYFYAMFTNELAEARAQRIEIKEVEGNALAQLVEFVYSSEIHVTEENVQVLLPAANLLQLQEVREACCDFLQTQLHPSNCLGIQRFADLHSCVELLNYARQYTEQHFGEVLGQDEEFLALSFPAVERLISSDRLTVNSEEQVLEAVLRWLKHDRPNREQHASDLFGHVRFPLLSQDYLLQVVEDEPLLKTQPPCKDLLIEALKYHLLKPEQKSKYKSERTKPRTPVGLPKILIVIGGQAPKAIRTVECYDFKEEKWSPVAEMPSRRCRCGVGVINGQVYAVGGFNGSLRVRSVEVYDPVRDSWSAVANMDARRSTLGVAVLNNILYAVGGFDGTSGLSSAESFDPRLKEWRMIQSMSTRRSSVGVGVLDGSLYAVGGYDGAGRQCLSSVERFDPACDVWTPVADMSCRRSGAGVGIVDGLLYAVGGHDGPLVRNSVEVYNPEGNKWKLVANMHLCRRNAGVVSYNGFLYVVGGDDGSSNLGSVECYDPKADLWTLLPSNMMTGRSYAGVAIIEKPI